MTAPISDPYTLGMARFSGALSASSSSILILIIARSIPRFSIVYHRIIFGISAADLLASMSIALTTIPMPKNLPEEIAISDSISTGLRLGNDSTCNAQGFLIIFGMVSMLMFNASLWIYYTCSIALQIDERKFEKRIEPFLLLSPVVIALTLSISLLVRNGYGISEYRVCCTVVNAGDLNNTSTHVNGEMTRSIFVGFLSSVFALSLICFLLIIYKIYRVEKELATKSRPILRQSQGLQIPRAIESYHNSKVIAVQATMYMLTIAFSFSTGLSITIFHGAQFVRIAYSLFPLQGFFNLLIFISHKIHNYRRANPSTSRFRTLLLIFNGQYQEPVFLSRTPYVFYYRGGSNRLEVQSYDESKYEEDSDKSGMEMQFDEHEFCDLNDQPIEIFFPSVNDHSTEQLFPIAEESGSSVESHDS